MGLESKRSESAETFVLRHNPAIRPSVVPPQGLESEECFSAFPEVVEQLEKGKIQGPVFLGNASMWA